MKTKKILSLAASAILLSSLSAMAACGKKPNPDAEGRTEIVFLADAGATSKPAFEKMVQAYNEGQGKTDGVYVTLKPSSGVSQKGENYFKQSSRLSLIHI